MDECLCICVDSITILWREDRYSTFGSFERDSLTKDRAWHSEYRKEIAGRFIAERSTAEAGA